VKECDVLERGKETWYRIKYDEHTLKAETDVSSPRVRKNVDRK